MRIVMLLSVAVQKRQCPQGELASPRYPRVRKAIPFGNGPRTLKNAVLPAPACFQVRSPLRAEYGVGEALENRRLAKSVQDVLRAHTYPLRVQTPLLHCSMRSKVR